jgi:hypothetical protein
LSDLRSTSAADVRCLDQPTSSQASGHCNNRRTHDLGAYASTEWIDSISRLHFLVGTKFADVRPALRLRSRNASSFSLYLSAIEAGECRSISYCNTDAIEQNMRNLQEPLLLSVARKMYCNQGSWRSGQKLSFVRLQLTHQGPIVTTTDKMEVGNDSA